MNPKSITYSQLYGDIDSGSGEWDNGIAQKIVEECAADESRIRHWVVFDGPVDALWIESMNTVLDDNKKLCLTNGSMIPLSERMTMMFEVEDLEVASPATVSRCGMIYLEPSGLGLKALFKSWIYYLPPSFHFRKTTIPFLEQMFDKYILELAEFVRYFIKEPVKTTDNAIVQNIFKILDCFYIPFWDTEVTKVIAEDIEAFEEYSEELFFYAITWAMGVTTDPEGRIKFNAKLREMAGKDNKHIMPKE